MKFKLVITRGEPSETLFLMVSPNIFNNKLNIFNFIDVKPIAYQYNRIQISREYVGKDY